MTEAVRCNCCGRGFPVEQLDIIDNGYRCAHCSEVEGVAQQIEAAAQEQREKGRQEGWNSARVWQWFRWW